MTLAESVESIRNQELPWGKLDKGVFEYTASPVIALEIAVRREHHHGTTSLGFGDNRNNRLSDIVSDAQRYELLNL